MPAPLRGAGIKDRPTRGGGAALTIKPREARVPAPAEACAVRLIAPASGVARWMLTCETELRFLVVG
jgi:hypothetical protein